MFQFLNHQVCWRKAEETHQESIPLRTGYPLNAAFISFTPRKYSVYSTMSWPGARNRQTSAEPDQKPAPLCWELVADLELGHTIACSPSCQGSKGANNRHTSVIFSERMPVKLRMLKSSKPIMFDITRGNDHYPHGGKKKVQGKSPADSAQGKQEAFPEDEVFGPGFTSTW